MQRVCDQSENQCTFGQGRLPSTASERSGSLSTNFFVEVSCRRHRQHFLLGVGIYQPVSPGVSIVAVVGDLLAAHQSRDGYRLAVRTRQRLRRPALVVLMPKLMLATAPNQHLHQPREHGQSLSQAI